MGRDKTVLPEDGVSMGRMDVDGNKDKCVKNNQTEEAVGPPSYVSIVVDGQDEHDTIRSDRWAKFSKKGSSDVNRRLHSQPSTGQRSIWTVSLRLVPDAIPPVLWRDQASTSPEISSLPAYGRSWLCPSA